ncbi:hypothetical protein [Halorubrum laminariae]|uniref:Uncharacterized protein n=1 Tax=Halorubrum laminariae TaxID=1433523 RepID=A0ABD6C068_9EURY|nr:hypothetical protein [Halorubrum laminariae]
MTPSQTSEQTPRTVAESLGMGFMYHDQRQRAASIEAFAAVDAFQFEHLDEAAAIEAGEAYVDALWEKDALEDTCRNGGELDLSELADADWSPIRDAFSRRATAVGMDPEYADCSTIAWRRHKVGGDYWTPMKQAQVYELQAALQDPDYPNKPREGQSGHGPEAARYTLGVELHDTRRFEPMVDVMIPYFERIAHRHQTHNKPAWNSD